MPPLRGPLRKKDSHLWERHPDDWYSEPTWCSARLFKLEKFTGRVVDPAAGFGRIVHSAMMAGLDHFGADKAERPGNWMRQDFMERWRGPALDNIVSNPPYGIAEKFVVRALDLAQYKVAMLLPANWVQGDARSRWPDLAYTPRPAAIAPEDVRGENKGQLLQGFSLTSLLSQGAKK